jgi:hypothetical protein
LAEKKEEEEWDYWFKRLRPMSKPKQMWQEKWLSKEGNGSRGNNSGEEEVEVTSAKGDSNPGWVSGNPESGNHNPDSGNSNPGKENDRQGEESVPMDVNMVFTIPTEFCAPMKDVTELVLGAECVVFDRSENPGAT